MTNVGVLVSLCLLHGFTRTIFKSTIGFSLANEFFLASSAITDQPGRLPRHSLES
jgi:hypothetical protein